MPGPKKRLRQRRCPRLKRSNLSRLLHEHQLWVLSGTGGPVRRPRPASDRLPYDIYCVYCRRPLWNDAKAYVGKYFMQGLTRLQ